MREVGISHTTLKKYDREAGEAASAVKDLLGKYVD